jgi:xanthine dehydrogenase accessory factor
MPEVELELAERIRRGEPVVAATVVRLDGQPPSRPGAKAIFDAQRPVAGTLGCAEFDAQAVADAARLLATGVPELCTYGHDLGRIEVYLEPHRPRPLLLVFGDTPVARQLAAWAPEVGFAVERATRTPDQLAGREVYAVHTDHDAPGLVDALEPVLRAAPRYVGVMGSRRHTAQHLEELSRRGVDAGKIETPVGLDIGALSAEEIALSILAGLVAARRGAGGGRLQSR